MISINDEGMVGGNKLGDRQNEEDGSSKIAKARRRGRRGDSLDHEVLVEDSRGRRRRCWSSSSLCGSPLWVTIQLVVASVNILLSRDGGPVPDHRL